MEHDDDRGGGEHVRMFLDLACLHPHILEGPIDGDHLADHQVELVDLELLLLDLHQLGGRLHSLAHLTRGSFSNRNWFSRLVFMELK